MKKVLLSVSVAVVAVNIGSCASETQSRGTFTRATNPAVEIEAVSGERHCDRLSVTYLQVGGSRFARDPDGLIPDDWLMGSYEATVELPPDAIDSGYRSKNGNEEIWFARDRDSIFVVEESEDTEEWPLVVKGFGCD